MTTPRTDDTRRLARVADDPVVAHDRRRLGRLLALYALLPLICATAATVVAYDLASGRMDRRVQALEADQAGRRAAEASANRQRDARLEQTQKDLCVVLDRLTARDKPVQDMRRRYGCTAPDPAPSTGAPGRAGPRPTSSTSRPAPAPGPARPGGPS
ncbi:hypothetical protein NCC78_01645, partial [Micromonospora phytophila]|uniref:hypothetical protein n=1 Tax=Micromonospora phytophila TaxID=709888 RepID=UPI00202F6312